jgi:uncharacterized protein YndB with AHSA1/START domain
MTDAATPQTELTATVTIDAPPAQVWSLLSDLTRMREWSPQVVRTAVVPQPVRLGSRMFNLNKQGAKRWPTTGKVVRFSPNRDIAFRITENRTIWSFQLEEADGGTRVTHRRETPQGISALSKVLTKVALGGQEPFVAELQRGMQQTLDRVKTAAEN